MIPIYFRDLPEEEDRGAELRLGWPTWDETGRNREMSIKYIYMRKDGRPSRGSPEVPVHIAVEMVDLAAQHNQLTREQVRRLLKRLKAL
jgi:hypothetical protein